VQAARLLGVTRNVIRNRMAKHGVGGANASVARAAPSEPDDEDTTGS